MTIKANLIKPTRYDGLEGLRGLMALWVVIGHVGNFMGWYLGNNSVLTPSWIKPLLLTSIPVNVFIALSGFVIFQMMHAYPKESYYNYIRARAFRILPIYLTALMIAILMISFRYNLDQLIPWISESQLSSMEQHHGQLMSQIEWHVISHVFLLHGVIPESLLLNSSQSILAPAWSLSLEWQFYLLAPIIFLIISKWKLGFISLLLILTLGSIFLSTTNEFTNAFLLLSWPYFALGWLSSRFLTHIKMADLKPNLGLILLCFILIIYSLFNSSLDPRTAFISLAIWLVVFFSCCGLYPQNWLLSMINKILSLKMIVELGKRSYSLYLLHALVIDIAAWAMIKMGWLTVSSLSGFFMLLGTTVILSLLVSWFTYKHIEKRFMWRRH